MNTAPDDRDYAVGFRKVNAPQSDPFYYAPSVDAPPSIETCPASPLYRFEAQRIGARFAAHPTVGAISIRSRKPRKRDAARGG